MLVVPRKDGRWQPYVGQTQHPLQRLRAHRRAPPLGVRRALAADDLDIDAVVYVPLQTVPAEDARDYETRWTVRANAPGTRGLNGFGAFGDPTQQRIFWQRRACAHASRSQRTS
jgi:hypothetical protein